jgi:hypothetical protein
LRGEQAAAPGSGIAFDTDPQSGDWLHVTTTGDDGSGRGMFLESTGGPAIVLEAAAIELHALTSSLSASATDYLFFGNFSGTDDFTVAVGGSVLLNSAGGTIGMGSGFATFGLTSGPMNIFTNSGNLNLTAVIGDIVADPGTGQFFIGTTVTPILLVTPDGGGSWNYHIKAGKAWIADL